MPNFTRPLVDLMVAESAARKAAAERGDDPDQCPETLELRAQLTVQRQIARRVDGTGTGGYDPLAYARYR